MRRSIWQATAQGSTETYPSLTGEIEADVAIVGGGITGTTCAVLLAAAGKRVVLLEARTIALGTTGNSTGNLYEVLSSGLAPVARKWGEEVAAKVAASRRHAVGLVEKFSSRLGPDTCFHRCALHQYSEGDWSEIDAEHEALRDAGVAAHFHDDAPLPGRSGRALVIDHQAQFHPLNYVRGMARLAAEAGARLFEHSEVLEVDDGRHLLRTASASVKAPHLVLATHTPKGIYGVHAQMPVYREYGVAREVEALPLPAGIFWQRGGTDLSFRNLEIAGKRYLILVGSAEKTGLHDAEQALLRLEPALLAQAPGASELCTWSAQGYQPPDLLPYIGPSPLGNAYIATGFGTDGLTYGTLAAQIITDNILGRENPWAELYRAARFSPVKSARQIMEEQVVALKGLVQDRVGVPDYQGPQSVAPGSGAVMKMNGRNVALYRDDAGALHGVSAACTHMGCVVHWNAVERSWDCPCHGSRFDIDGRVIEGPALSPLKTIAPGEPSES
jgi:glycine/D-amino acid oxidase-like deaminating enzyme/nitrite reductase/ring-hydroxylating ferredoxin subunit